MTTVSTTGASILSRFSALAGLGCLIVTVSRIIKVSLIMRVSTFSEGSAGVGSELVQLRPQKRKPRDHTSSRAAL